MDKFNELMKSIENFNTLIADVEHATNEMQNQINNSFSEKYKECLRILKPYKEMYDAVGTTDYVVIEFNYGTMGMYISFRENGIYFQPKNPCGMFYLCDDLHPANIKKITPDLYGILSNEKDFAYFEKEFLLKLNKIMEDKVRKVNKKYQCTCELKNQMGV